jgi:GNAT acetyltransferase-like protein
MINVTPVVLEGNGIRLEPLTGEHAPALAEAAADGRLWELWFTAVPEPQRMGAYVEDALKGQRDGHMLPWAVRDLPSGALLGSTRYHDVVPSIDRVEIGYTWYRESVQRTHVNTSCWPTLSTPSDARSSACGPTTSTSARSGPSRGWGRRRTASYGTTPRAGTERSATR